MLNTMQRIQENVFMLSGSSELTPNVPIAAARHWYNRIKNYAWDKPAISTKSTQFTQLIWAASQQVIFCLWFYHVDFPYSSMFYMPIKCHSSNYIQVYLAHLFLTFFTC